MYPMYIPMSDTITVKDIHPVNDEYVFLFDIDHTLYKMDECMHKDEIKSWVDVYNTLRGNKKDVPTFREILGMSPMYGGAFYSVFNICAKEAEDFRGMFDYSKYLEKDIRLRNKLSSIPYRKWCFTNGLESRAKSVLGALDIEDCFEGVVCMDDNSRGDFGKPFLNSYLFVERILGITKKENVIFFDDNENNIKTGRDMGWKSIIVREEDDIIDLISQAENDIKLRPER
jgi:pyrimidine and pyridine-specific 5'-nucleotidase